MANAQNQKQSNGASTNAIAGGSHIEMGILVDGPSSANDDTVVVDPGFNHEEMGMTNERQRVIQASLFKMLGQEDDEDREPSSVTEQQPSK